MSGAKYKHKKRGTIYTVVYDIVAGSGFPKFANDESRLMIIKRTNGSGEVISHTTLHDLSLFDYMGELKLIIATLQLSEGDRIKPGDRIVVYVGDDSRHWVRKYDEFHDGRFELIEGWSEPSSSFDVDTIQQNSSKNRRDELREIFGGVPNAEAWLSYLGVPSDTLSDIFSPETTVAPEDSDHHIKKAGSGQTDALLRITQKKHPSHHTRSSDASSFDEVCVNCNNTDIAGGGWGKLADPCPNATNPGHIEEAAAYTEGSRQTRETPSGHKGGYPVARFGWSDEHPPILNPIEKAREWYDNASQEEKDAMHDIQVKDIRQNARQELLDNATITTVIPTDIQSYIHPTLGKWWAPWPNTREELASIDVPASFLSAPPGTFENIDIVWSKDQKEEIRDTHEQSEDISPRVEKIAEVIGTKFLVGNEDPRHDFGGLLKDHAQRINEKHWGHVVEMAEKISLLIDEEFAISEQFDNFVFSDEVFTKMCGYVTHAISGSGDDEDNNLVLCENAVVSILKLVKACAPNLIIKDPPSAKVLNDKDKALVAAILQRKSWDDATDYRNTGKQDAEVDRLLKLVQAYRADICGG